MRERTLIAVAVVLMLSAAFLSVPVSAGIEIINGETIISRTGNTSPMMIVRDTNIIEGNNISLDVSSLTTILAKGTFTNANFDVSTNSSAASWTGAIEYDSGTGTYILNLTSSGGPTLVGENVTVTFTGARGSPWISDTGGAPLSSDPPLAVTRFDTLETGEITVSIETTSGPGCLDITPGAKITTATGASTAVINISDAPILQFDTITIDITELNMSVLSHTITDANVIVSDTARNATWTGVIGYDSLYDAYILTLTSTCVGSVGGENCGITDPSDKVSVTFTGAQGSPWEPTVFKPITLTAVRQDNMNPVDFPIIIDFKPIPDFTASPRTGISPLAVTFTDLSAGSPTIWNWSFGDGVWFNTTKTETDADPAKKNPTHPYTSVGTYMVCLTAENDYGSDTKTQDIYIHVLNSAIREANTSINGLTITPGSPQSVTVDTSVLTQVALIPNNSVLEIKPPADRGWNNITFYAMPGIFTSSSNTISGTVTGVRLVSEEIRPSPGFSVGVGPESSFNYSIDLSSYPTNAVISTKIIDGIIPEDDANLEKLAAGNTPTPIMSGTAYTAKITKTNFPSTKHVKIHMSVDDEWPGDDNITIWRISDDNSQGQFLSPTFQYLKDNLLYYEADSPLGLSTFGLSSYTGNNNPFQLIALTVAQEVSPPSEPSTSESYTGPITSATGAKNLEEPGVIAQGAPPADQGQTANIYANPDGVITQATTLQSTDGIATVNVELGVVAKDADNNPLTSISIAAVSEVNVPALSGATVSYAGIAYNLQPDGATFSPAISISFTVPPGQAGQDFTIRSYDPVSHTWQELPTTYDPATGTVTAQVSHFCLFAVFTKMVSKAPTLAATPIVTPLIPTTLKPPSPTIATTFLGIVLTVINLLVTNPILVAGIVILAVGIVIMVWKQRRDRLYPKS